MATAWGQQYLFQGACKPSSILCSVQSTYAQRWLVGSSPEEGQNKEPQQQQILPAPIHKGSDAKVPEDQ